MSRFRWLLYWYKNKERSHKKRRKENNYMLIVIKKKFCKLDTRHFRTFERHRNAYIRVENVPYVALSQVTWDFAFYAGTPKYDGNSNNIPYRVMQQKIVQQEIFYVTRIISDIIIAHNYSRLLRVRFHLCRMFLNRVLCFINVSQIIS